MTPILSNPRREKRANHLLQLTGAERCGFISHRYYYTVGFGESTLPVPVAEYCRSMKWILPAMLCFALMGCDRPSSKAARIQQVRQEVVRGGGESKILNESRILFARCSTQDWSSPFVDIPEV
jgi:hypothetical protein